DATLPLRWAGARQRLPGPDLLGGARPGGGGRALDAAAAARPVPRHRPVRRARREPRRHAHRAGPAPRAPRGARRGGEAPLLRATRAVLLPPHREGPGADGRGRAAHAVGRPALPAPGRAAAVPAAPRLRRCRRRPPVLRPLRRTPAHRGHRRTAEPRRRGL
ncbi:MAG: Transcriptional regulator, HxlR family, partial [uncultured Pseudonocardia sp.]